MCKEKLEFGCKKQKLNRFRVWAVASISWEILACFKGLVSNLPPLTVANEVQFIGKDLGAWRSQEYNHHMLGR